MLLNLLYIPLAFIYGAVAEWVLHKYVLHGLGKKKKSIFSFHWHTHHKQCRKNGNYDENYDIKPRTFAYKKEVMSLVLLVLVHLPYLFFLPYFFGGLLLFTVRYFYFHKRAHTSVAWGKKHMPWHYDHHMGRNQDANYGVTFEWVDKLMGTRKKYAYRRKHE